MKTLNRIVLLAAMSSLNPSLTAQSILHRIDSILTLNYRKNNIDTAYITRPATKWTIRARMNVSGAKIEAEGVDRSSMPVAWYARCGQQPA
jgi:hypothetical protein